MILLSQDTSYRGDVIIMDNIYFLNTRYLRTESGQRLQMANIYFGRLSIVNVDASEDTKTTI